MSKKKVLFLTVSVGMMLTLLAAAVFGQSVQKESVYRYLSVFSEVFSVVTNNYVEPVAPEALVDGAFDGVTQAVDEFSFYVPPQNVKEYREHLTHSQTALGAQISKRYGYAYVISTAAGSASEQAGLKAGDLIEKIDGQPTEELAIWQVRDRLRAERKTPVLLQVVQSGMSKRSEISIEPKNGTLKAPAAEMIGSIAHIKVPHFSNGSANQFRRAVEGAKEKGATKLIVDLRGNAVGEIEEAIKAADDLLAAGTITGTSGRRLEPQKWAADKETTFDGDVVVLTDASTAAASEVFAAAISGNSRGRTVGQPTYGMAVIQKDVDLASGGVLHVTIGHYTTPKLEAITDQGVKPDITVERIAIGEDEEKPDEDPILDRALSLLAESELKKAA